MRFMTSTIAERATRKCDSQDSMRRSRSEAQSESSPLTIVDEVVRVSLSIAQ